jgi:hypothetical protein
MSALKMRARERISEAPKLLLRLAKLLHDHAVDRAAIARIRGVIA